MCKWGFLAYDKDGEKFDTISNMNQPKIYFESKMRTAVYGSVIFIPLLLMVVNDIFFNTVGGVYTKTLTMLISLFLFCFIIFFALYPTSTLKLKENFVLIVWKPDWVGGLPKKTEPEKCDEVGWFDIDTLPENMVPKCKFAIEKYLAGEYFSEFDWDKKVA